MATIRELIDDKIHEVFYEYQQSHGITNGDIEPFDAEYLDRLETQLADHIQRICQKQSDKINFYDLVPSWYIYTDCDGEAHSEAFGQITEDQFFTKVSKKICFDDLDDTTVQRIFYKGREYIYAGWQPGMKYEFLAVEGEDTWVGYFPEWDH